MTRRVAVTMIGIVAIAWGGAMALLGVGGLALWRDPASAILLFVGILAMALGSVAIRHYG